MATRPVVHLRGSMSSLMHALVERLMRTDSEVIVDEPLFRELSVKRSSDLEYSQMDLVCRSEKPFAPGHRMLMLGLGPFDSPSDGSSGLDVDGAELILVTPSGSFTNLAPEYVDAHVDVHDMIPMHGGGGWMPPVLADWFSNLACQEVSLPSAALNHWWVGEIDVADALVRLLLSDHPFPVSSKMAGRRAWLDTQTYEECHMLHRRTVAGQSGAFGVEELTSAPTPTIELQSLMVSDTPPLTIEENRQERPDLCAIHDALHAADGDGWRPLIPVRTALMHCLATLTD